MLSAFLSLALLIRIVVNPLSNVYQKQLTQRSLDPLFITVVTYGLLTAAGLALSGGDLMPASGRFWLPMTACAVLAVLGNVFLVRALRVGDLSVLGPINAYKSVVSLIFGIIILDEMPGGWGLLGIGFIVAGSYFVLSVPASPDGFTRQASGQKGLLFRLLALVCSAIDGVFLKKALLFSNPRQAFFYWCLFGFLLSGLWLILSSHKNRLGRQWELAARNVRTVFLLAGCVGLMQLSTNWVLERMPVSYALALFQLSVLLSVLFGYRFFGETNVRRKLLGAGIMIIGAVLIILLG